ncbi:MAG: hypothetical protein ACRDE2_14795, partial [Chitinophagaceae bacterium]
VIPFLVGFRYMLNTGNGGYYDEDMNSGFYAEPLAGYTIGGTDIPRLDSTGNIRYDNNGNEEDEMASGITGGISFGYIFPGIFRFNIGLRYEHIFVKSPDPPFNLISLRFSHTISFHRRDN